MQEGAMVGVTKGAHLSIRSASVRTEVKDVGSSSVLVIQVHGSRMATSEERVQTGKSL